MRAQHTRSAPEPWVATFSNLEHCVDMEIVDPATTRRSAPQLDEVVYGSALLKTAFPGMQRELHTGFGAGARASTLR